MKRVFGGPMPRILVILMMPLIVYLGILAILLSMGSPLLPDSSEEA